MLKNVIFDMGNVLLLWDPEVQVPHYSDDPAVQQALLRELFRHPDWARLDSGELQEDDLYDIVKERLPESAHAALRCALDTFDAYAPAFAHVMPMMHDLKAKGYRLFVLSNASARFRYRLELQDFYPLLDGIVISAEEKAVKPDKAIFDCICGRYALNPAECVFVDDIEANVQGARDAGLYGIQYNGDPEKLIKDIRDAELLL